MASTSEPEQKGPLHVLMAIPAAEQHKMNPRVQRDFISKRAAAYKINVNPNSVWANVKDIERSLIQCCELPDDMNEDALSVPAPFSASRTGSGYFPLLGGGALDKEKEIQFLGILAKDCRTLSSRSLALAILERTLELQIIETDEAVEELEQSQRKAEAEAAAGDDDDDDDEHDYNGDIDAKAKAGETRRSKRLSKEAPKYKRTKRKFEEVEKREPDNKKWGRLEQFMAAGGLKLLSRWLAEGLEDEIVTNKQSNELDIQTSSTRPLILPICRFLERIPFDKNLVVESKIPKQIRRLEKGIEAFLKARARGDHHPDDLKGWTPQTTDKDTDGLHAVQDAVNMLKKAWQQNTKQRGDGFADPFEDLKAALRQRLSEVTKFEAGMIPRPDWLPNLEEESKKPKKSRVELAAKERMMEVLIENERTEARRKELDEARRKHSEYVKQLREKMQASHAAYEKKSSGKRIKWKDGLISKDYRDRKTLEEVFVFNYLTPANKEMNEIVRDEGQPSKSAPANGVSEPEEQAGEDTEEDDMIDLTVD
jgi:hypothetical protein